MTGWRCWGSASGSGASASRSRGFGSQFFGTDYPFTTVNASVDGIRGLNDMLEGTKLPRLNPEQIEQMIHRDTLKLLCIE